ncbi:hypothetical protein NL108_013931 [Boleophthalmus pectinirostris]|uniref:mitogen-activated protein kinase-binding protein 1-like n=1 Tax=Boleophthalmus pectinirostris TaxID=150288 RepID=UPI0024330B5A|nr:mitogen-activated protein kinase-binding protein 1-like [Boleophthalmus pectinirostris]KAJ0061262.1 hypothetical protein NL108_013931 [Boleophthalmus pectinirostris]
MPGDGFTFRGRIRNLLRSPSTKLQGSRKESISSQVTLERVLGVTTTGNSGLTCDPCSGLVAYPAGCVVVLLNPKNHRQQHIINTSGKTITALSFSPDGKYLVTGESGHLPAVRLWDVAQRHQVAELQSHKYGISCVAFSPNGKYIVTVGNQHDMMIHVWAWKKNVVVAANKVSSKVSGVSFSEDSSYFVTVGNRHVKFWYLDQCKTNKSSAPVPLLGRSGLLGDLRYNFFSAAACGRGLKSDSAFCLTSSGLLCEFNHRRTLDRWVDLKTGAAHSLCVSEDLVFCGCSNGTVRVFSSTDLSFVCTLPRPHTTLPHPQTISSNMDARYPDAIAVTFDPVRGWLSCVYSDHSVFVWDLRDVKRVEKVHSALYHSACVWDLQMFPDVPCHSGLSSGSFFSCSADNTIRVWWMSDSVQTPLQPKNLITNDLLNILYIDGNPASPVDSESTTHITADKTGDGQSAENRTGIRVISVSPDGKHLASGDRNGILRVHDLNSLEQILKVEAHDAEILCLEYSQPDTGVSFLASASRDRLIHVLDSDTDYSLVQTLDDHSSSITALKFTANDDKVRLISCGADKSIYFRTAHETEGGAEFHRSHHSVKKSTLYDMSIDPTCRYAAVGCQDRCIRLFDISSGKQKKAFKGSLSEDGSLLKVQIDPSGLYIATSCSDKNISIFDFYTGECVTTMFGHSEIVTGLKFTSDCKHLISVSADSCVFVWRLAPELALKMRQRLRQLREDPSAPIHRTDSRRELHSAPPLEGLSLESDHEHEDTVTEEEQTVTSDSSHEEEDTGGSDEGQDWELPKPRTVTSEQAKRPRRQWSLRGGSLELMVKSMLDLRQLETFGQKKSPNSPNGSLQTWDRRSMCNLQDPLVDYGSRQRRTLQHSDWRSLSRSVPGAEEVLPFTEDRESDYRVKRPVSSRGQWRGRSSKSQESQSPDSACSVGYDSRESSPDYLLDEVDSLNQDSSEEIEGAEKEEGEEDQVSPLTVSSVEEALRTVTEDHTEDIINNNHQDLKHNKNNSSNSNRAAQSPVPSFSSRFLSRGQNSAKPPVSKVRPLMGNVHDRFTEDVKSTNDKCVRSDTVSAPLLRAQKNKRPPGGHLWRRSIPSAKAPPLDTSNCLYKAHSVQNLPSQTPVSPVPSSERRQTPQRPQHLFLDRPKPSLLLSSPPSSSFSSSLSPLSPLPWDPTPSPRTPHSYMNPTASSIAKISRSFSVGEGLQLGSPPRSPNLTKKQPNLDAADLPLLASSPVGFSLSKSPSPTPPRHTSITPCVVSPSRIPQLRHPVSPRRCLAPEFSQSRSCAPTSPDLASVTASGNDKPVHRPHTRELPVQSPLPLKTKTRSVCESVTEAEQVEVVEGEERPLVDEQSGMTSADSKKEESITVETCRQVISELQDCLRRSIHAYTTVVGSGSDLTEDQQQMKSLLSAAFVSIKTELHSLPPPPPLHPQEEGSQVDTGEGDKTLVLLEQYAQLLLQSVEKKLDNKT